MNEGFPSTNSATTTITCNVILFKKFIKLYHRVTSIRELVCIDYNKHKTYTSFVSRQHSVFFSPVVEDMEL